MREWEEVSLRIVLHPEIPEDPQLCRQWNNLALQMERPEVFYTFEWAQAMQSAYHATLKPLLFLGYEGDELVGVASLATDADQENASFLAATTADYCDILSRPQLRTEFTDAVLAESLVQLDELARIIAELDEFTNDPTTVLSLPRVFQAVARRA